MRQLEHCGQEFLVCQNSLGSHIVLYKWSANSCTQSEPLSARPHHDTRLHPLFPWITHCLCPFVHVHSAQPRYPHCFNNDSKIVQIRFDDSFHGYVFLFLLWISISSAYQIASIQMKLIYSHGCPATCMFLVWIYSRQFMNHDKALMQTKLH